MPLDFINWRVGQRRVQNSFKHLRRSALRKVLCFQPITIFIKLSILDEWQGSSVTFVAVYWNAYKLFSINVEEKKRIRNILEVIFSKGKHFDLNIIIQKSYRSVTMWLCNMSLLSLVFLVISWVFSMLIFLFSYLNLFIYPQPHRTYTTLLVTWKLHHLRRRFTSWQDDKKLIKHSNFLQSILIISWFTDPNSRI